MPSRIASREPSSSKTVVKDWVDKHYSKVLNDKATARLYRVIERMSEDECTEILRAIMDDIPDATVIQLNVDEDRNAITVIRQ